MRIAPLCVLMALAACGCSRFETDWRSDAVRNVDAGRDELSGRWKGNWKSEKSGHGGSLRAIVTKLDENTYRARFDASWAMLMRFGYEIKLTPDRQDGVAYLNGEQNIGEKFGGNYEYEGKADGKIYRCNYRTKNDYGHFRMTRPR